MSTKLFVISHIYGENVRSQFAVIIFLEQSSAFHDN